MLKCSRLQGMAYKKVDKSIVDFDEVYATASQIIRDARPDVRAERARRAREKEDLDHYYYNYCYYFYEYCFYYFYECYRAAIYGAEQL